MARYKVKHTSIMHNKKVYGEGSEIELTDIQAKRLEDYVELINEPLIKQSKAQSKTVKMSVKAQTGNNDNETLTNEDEQPQDNANTGSEDANDK